MANDLIGVGTTWVPQTPNTSWSVTSSNELSYDGTEPVGDPAVIGTTFDGLTATSTWSYYAGLTLTFDAKLSSNANHTFTVVLGAKDVWASKKGIFIQFNKNSVQVVPNNYVVASTVKLSTDDAAYQAKVLGDAYNTIKIEVTEDGGVFVTVNGYTCPGAFAAGNGFASPMNTSAPANRPALFCCTYAGFKLKNLIAVKAACNPGTGTTGSPTVFVAGGTKTFFTVASGINETKIGAISVYPNPVKNNLIIANEQVGQQFCVKNLLGQEIKTGIITGNQHLLDLSDLKTGNYMLVIQSDKGVKSTSIIKI